MTFKEYQEKSKETAIYLDRLKSKYPDLPKEIYKILSLSYLGNGLGEVGEIQGKIKKIIRDNGGSITKDMKKEISKECGDCLWYLSQLATELELDLGEIAGQNLEKLNSRKQRNVLGGSGDNR